ncbi:MAG: type II toxin-antitoxin system PemK/MazF family toxin [Dehalococcoidia bacterium]|nr:type II toxin-antitoxin system PemK/MazF family toxin [Dehalococcoidia bacterium]
MANPLGIHLKRGDIVLVPFPFTDLTTEKLRPAVIISAEPQESDIVIAFISSIVPSGELPMADFLLAPNHPDFYQTGLKKASVFKMKKLLTIERTRLIRRLGKISPGIQKELDERLKEALSL